MLSTLNHKEKYVIHHRNLKQYLQMGFKLKKIHRIIKFKEEAWLKPYIELNTKLRANGKNDFEKDFFKLMNNSVFGKTMENIKKRVDIKLVNNRKSALRFAAKPNFESCTIFDENLIAIHMKRVKLLFDKPVFCGMSILDISKTLIFDFHFNYINKNIKKKQNSFSLTLILFAMKSKQKTFSKTFQMMFMKSLTHQISQKTIHQTFQLESTKK